MTSQTPDQTPSKSILIVEDEPDMVRGLRDTLAFEGFSILVAPTGREGVEMARRKAPDLVLLDLMLPDINGYQVCEEIRAIHPRLPIIMLSARSLEADKVRGLEAGADDYVTKPFSIAELIARVHAVLRRSERVGHGPERLCIGQAVVDLRKYTLSRGDEVSGLSFYEAELLKLLHERLDEPVSRDEILDRIWGMEANPTNRTVDNFIVKLRRKLEEDHKNPRHILTVHGLGYKLVL